MSSLEAAVPGGVMSLCSGCGVVAPTEVDRCDACKASLPPPQERLRAPVRGDGRYWIEVRAQFQCKHCDKRSPVNQIDVDGTFTCLRCQRDQRADAGIWATGLRFCHEVADLAGPEPEGRHPDPEARIGDANKWADIGVTRTRAKMDFSETTMSGGDVRRRSLFLHARPGVPLCPRCRVPLDVRVEESGQLASRCGGCGASARYEVDPKASRMVKGFVGVLADDHRTDRPATKMANAEPGAPVAIACPGCGAALDLEAEDHFVTCTYCRTPSKIPSRMRARLFTEGVELEPMWLLFEGPSQARQKLVKKAKKARAHAERQEAREEERRRAADAEARQVEAAAAAGRLRVAFAVAAAVLAIAGFLLLR